MYLNIQTQIGLFSLLTVFMWYALVPLADWLVGTSVRKKLGAEAQLRLEGDVYYRYVALIMVPLHYLSVVVFAWYVSTHPLTFALLGHTISIGLATGLAINLGHELGHKSAHLDRLFAKLALALSGYGHFTIEHNRGHHRNVATPEDPASARFGESIYSFASREVIGNLRGAWISERSQLAIKGKNRWGWQNEILQPLFFTVLLYGTLVLVFGIITLPFLFAQAALAWWQLTSTNYVEHYGLARRKLENGRYERCGSVHSWNSDCFVSNLTLLNLQRHSDHHVHAARPYQALRNFEVVPQLPAGYPLMFLAALLPPLWRAIMDPRVLQQVGGDMKRVNC